MRKSQIVLLIMLGIGALVTGVGAGAAFAEYSSMEYEGTVLIGEEYWKTDTFTCEWETEEDKPLWIDPENYPSSWNVELVGDETVAAGEVAVDITYNEAVYAPHVSLEPVMEAAEEEAIAEAGAAEAETSETEETAGTAPEEAETAEAETAETASEEPEAAQPQKAADRLEIWISYEGNDFDILMEHKNEMLSMLKEGKMASFEMATVKEVKIRIHPDRLEDVVKEIGSF